VAEAQLNLGYMYAVGKGVTQSDHAAFRWYRKAVEQGLAKAQANLGVMYANGEGLTKGPIRAYMWFSLAEHNGYKLAISSIEKTAKQMTKPQIFKAQEIFISCLESDYTGC
jgi:TPR repeat protein